MRPPLATRSWGSDCGNGVPGLVAVPGNGIATGGGPKRRPPALAADAAIIIASVPMARATPAKRRARRRPRDIITPPVVTRRTLGRVAPGCAASGGSISWLRRSPFAPPTRRPDPDPDPDPARSERRDPR